MIKILVHYYLDQIIFFYYSNKVNIQNITTLIFILIGILLVYIIEKINVKTKIIYGLIGKRIDYSFSKKYFNQKFKVEGFINHSYENFDCKNLSQVLKVFKKNIKG